MKEPLTDTNAEAPTSTVPGGDLFPEPERVALRGGAAGDCATWSGSGWASTRIGLYRPCSIGDEELRFRAQWISDYHLLLVEQERFETSSNRKVLGGGPADLALYYAVGRTRTAGVAPIGVTL
jgi:hypothetical protein